MVDRRWADEDYAYLAHRTCRHELNIGASTSQGPGASKHISLFCSGDCPACFLAWFDAYKVITSAIPSQSPY